MVLQVSCSVGGITFSRNFFKPLLPRHIWRKIQLESDSLPYNQLIFLFSYRFFFTTGPTSNPQKTSSRLLCLVTTFLLHSHREGCKGHTTTTFTTTTTIRRDGPDETDPLTNQPGIIIKESLQDELRTAPSRELKTSAALPPSIKTRLEYLSAPNPSAAFLPRGGVDSFTHPKLKGTDSSGKSSATEINRPGTILVRGVVSRKNQRTDHRRTAIDPPCKYS
jgi:hypothetical protein